MQQFQRQQADGPMSAAERAQKKRVRAALFPQKVAAARTQDRTRKRDAKLCVADDSDPDENPQQMTPTTAETVLQQYRRKAVQSCVDSMLCSVERAHAAGTVDPRHFIVVPQHVYFRGVWVWRDAELSGVSSFQLPVSATNQGQCSGLHFPSRRHQHLSGHRRLCTRAKLSHLLGSTSS